MIQIEIHCIWERVSYKSITVTILFSATMNLSAVFQPIK